MQLDLKALRTLLKEAPQEETVDSSNVNPYLLQKVLMPLLAETLADCGNVQVYNQDALKLDLPSFCSELKTLPVSR